MLHRLKPERFLFLHLVCRASHYLIVAFAVIDYTVE